ncbi:MAG: phenylalanine--tRNA ligase subunit alpha [Chloroflexota bacterium]|nr:phenylalanine--tRNA ligase subunit alpha [Chloroflexota bacterium]
MTAPATVPALDTLRAEAISALDAASDLDALLTWERAYLGPKGALTAFLRSLGNVPADQRPEAGRSANALKIELQATFSGRHADVERSAIADRLAAEALDVTLPGRPHPIGTVHPISAMIDELSDIFALMGFRTVYGPEVETGHYNFDLLNIPADHPARDVWDTMIVDTGAGGPEIVLRTHTSPMQARTMETTTPPVRVVVPGRCYRYEAQDASHEWMFHQLEGLAVDERITMADLKGVLAELARQLFGPTRRIRFRCDFFPFVEPGVDFAVDCAICDGTGCRVCKHTGWLEMGGAGMVHPDVLRGVGYDPERFTGFAFGLGIARMVMMKYGVDDVRAFAAGDLRFLRQFASLTA